MSSGATSRPATGRLSREERDIQSFLRLGYFIHYEADRRPIDFARIDRAAWAHTPPAELRRIGLEKARETFAALYRPGGLHLIPLSGGMDSRFILACLLEHTDAGNLHTLTYGTPGTYDFEIGCKLAKFVGTRHSAIPINKYSYHLDELLDTAKRTQNQALLFHHPPLWEMDRRFGGATIWSGYVGDAVAGSHLHDPPATSLDAARRAHLHHRTFVHSTRLHTCDDDEFLPYMGGGGMDPHALTWDEQVLFGEAVAKFTAPLVLFDGFDWQTPLINTPWMDLLFSVPDHERHGQKLMFDIGREAFPKLFNFPCKNRVGHTFDTPDAIVKATFYLNRARRLAHRFIPGIQWPSSQFNDFNEELRRSPDLREIVRGSVADLKARGICDWIDVDALWRRHDRRTHDHGDALVTMASLEIVLKSRELAERSASSARAQP